MKQLHDSKIGWQMIKHDLDKLTIPLLTKATTGGSFAKDCTQKASNR